MAADTSPPTAPLPWCVKHSLVPSVSAFSPRFPRCCETSVTSYAFFWENGWNVSAKKRFRAHVWEERMRVFFCCIIAARGSRVAFLNRSHTHSPAHVTRIRKTGLVLHWLPDQPGVSRPPDKILLLQNQPTSRQGITCCLLLLWEPDFLVVFFFSLDSLCFETSLELRYFKKAYLLSLASSKEAHLFEFDYFPWSNSLVLAPSLETMFSNCTLKFVF